MSADYQSTIWARWCDYETLCHTMPPEDGDVPGWAKWSAETDKLELAIATTPSDTLSDVRAKIKLLAKWQEIGPRTDRLDEYLVAGVIIDLDRLDTPATD